MGTGSFVGNLAAKRANLIRQRGRLTGGGERGAPQAPTRAQPNPPPATPPEPGAPEAPAAPGTPSTEAEALEMAGAFLNDRGRQVQGQTPTTTPREVQGLDARPVPGGTPLKARIGQLGATNRPPEVQFFRLAGREPSPRELMLFQARVTLENQLNRPPTVDEFRTFIQRASSVGPLFSPAVEPSVAQGPPPGA